MTPHGLANPAAAPIRVLLAEDLALLRTSLTAVLAAEDDMAVVAALPCDKTISATTAHPGPDVAIVGVDENGSRCLTTLRTIQQVWPGCRTIALADAGDIEVSAQLVAAAVHAIVDKHTSARHLLTVVRAVAGGTTVIPKEFADAARIASRNPLTVRERQVLLLVANGATAPEIARQLRLTHGTVRNYISSAMTKTAAHTRIDAIRAARRFGWL